MSQIDYLQAVILGVIQGLTEFLPVSSSGHLAVVQGRMNLNPDGADMLLFDVLVHVGTLVAVAIVFARPATRFARRLARESSPSWSRQRIAWRIALLGVVATIPTGVIGLTFRDTFESAFGRPVWIGVCLIVTGLLLGVLAICPRGRRGWKSMPIWQAVLIGLAQAAAILPGISRSGATICMASYCGWRRPWAAQFSFLIAVPAIVGGAGLKALEALASDATTPLALDPSSPGAMIPWGPVLMGSIVSLVVGVVALRILLGAVRKAKLHYFALYCWAFGAYVLLTA